VLLNSVSYEKFKAQDIWKCGPLRSGETAPADYSENLLRFVETEDGLQNLSAKAGESFFNKFGPAGYVGSFDIKLIREILLLQYRGSHMATDDSKFDKWWEAYKILYNINNAGDPAAKKASLEQVGILLGEKSSGYDGDEDIKLEEILFPYYNGNKNFLSQYIGVIPSSMVKVGYGPRTSNILANLVLPYPFVLGSLPMNPSLDETQVVTVNRRVVSDILRTCIAEYKDPKKSAQEIAKGPCGIVNIEDLNRGKF